MLKKSIFTIMYVAFFLSLMSLQTAAQEPANEEIELAGLITKADLSLDMHEVEISEFYLIQAKNIIIRNPEINLNLRAHFNKVSGKVYMKTSFEQSLGYFNTAASQFENNPSELAQIKLFTGIAYYYSNDLTNAEICFKEAKTYFATNRDDLNLAQALNNLGVTAYKQNDAEKAEGFFEQALSINIRIKKWLNASRNQFNLDCFGVSSASLVTGDKTGDLDGGGGGTSGSGTTISTSGSGTVVVGSGGNGGLSVNK